MVNAVATFLDAHVEAGRAGTIAVVTPHETLSYEDLHALTCRAGAALRRLGVEPEQRVALFGCTIRPPSRPRSSPPSEIGCGRRAAEHAHDTRAGDRDPRRQPREGSGGRSPAARAPARRAGRTASSLRDRRNKA